MNKLIIIGTCIWIPIWIFAFIPFFQKIIKGSDLIGAMTVFIMVVGNILMFIGIFKKER